ncbi:hypothetical protein C1646_675710 [Rhizophagus diaphanus]|nr:hypothetical protein C1646_675710 [Rhizophagus diaphanus] [Rhizophagus sp. MUCL 43196]
MSESLLILKEVIKRLGFISNEKISLFSYFTGNEKNQTDALSHLNDCESDEEKHNYLISLVSSHGLLYNKEITDQIKFLYEHFKSESKSASLSTINYDFFLKFLNFSKLKMRYECFSRTYPNEDVDPYKWNSHAEKHKSQIEKIIEYLKTHLKPILPDEVIIEDVANKKGFLKVHKNSIMPFNINGGTDIILVEEQCVRGKALKLGIYAIFELKKIVEEIHIYQTVLKMVIADCYVSNNVKVFGVLTDLKDVWNIFWFTINKNIAMISLKNCKIAFEVINKMVRSDNPRIEGISNTKRVKYMDYFDKRINTPSDDIASMDDFIEEMDESEEIDIEN